MRPLVRCRCSAAASQSGRRAIRAWDGTCNLVEYSLPADSITNDGRRSICSSQLCAVSRSRC
jgi:hypothetical protein